MPWMLLLGTLFAGYLTLAARDYGPALLGDRGRFDPRFFGRQVWLVGAAGLLVGAFPALEGELLARHAAVVTPALAGTVLATVAIPLRRRRLAAIGSALAAAGWGGLIGALLTNDPAGTVALATVYLTLTAAHAAALRADRITVGLTLITLGAGAAVVLNLAWVRGRALAAYPDGLWIVVLLGVLAVTAYAAWRRRWRLTRAATLVALALPVPFVTALTWPYALIPAADGTGGATWEHTLADPATLRLLGLVALPALPLAALAQLAGSPLSPGRAGGRKSRVEGHSPELG